MKLKITHTTTYAFNSEVFLEPHYLRFRPRQTAYVDLNEFSMSIVPKPSGHKIIQDEENNVVDFCWFDGVTNSLSITVESVLETKPFNPFDFILEPQSYNQLPFEYDESKKKLLFPHLDGFPISQEFIEYGTAILEKAKFNTIHFLTQLTNQLHKDFTVEYREDGAPFLPEHTFEIKRGSCRDLSWMLINLLRHQGIAARFVSGYYYFDMIVPAFELHAWVDVFLPGIGWLGLDPSHGILTGNTHFPIATSSHYENTMPVSGGIRGSASSKLITELQIEKI